ncbi:MAG: hypothetical protein A3I72_04890 [Candidatus Tectomicrobia bacterium RIFCSPLOWO2_02_FULL_70_19]|nr:MAG: hypothetical protein A3I72_04890 [Candidatus Tectomicrobia bacterium RIFCSPLOWO2_02_FULL_70_19]
MPAALSRLLRPESIAIVGLSADPAKHGQRVLTFLRRFGYQKPVWGVNPNTPEVPGAEVFPRLRDLSRAPDAIVLAIPPPAIPGVLEEAGEVGAGGAILFSGGFAEAGKEGASLQARIRDIARAGGVRLLGPNSAGIVHAAAGTVMSFLTCLERPAGEIRDGPVGLITQSGGNGSFIHNLAADRGSGLAISVSTGNEADVQAGEILEWLAGHPQVRVVAMLIETVRDGERFLNGARKAIAAGRPMVACKIGNSESGRRAVQTHTGALAGALRVYEAVFESLGIVSTRSPEEMFEVAEVLARAPVPKDDGVGVVTHSGGTAVQLADRADEAGVSLPAPSPGLQERLGPFLQFGAAANPADLGGIVTQPERFPEVVRCFLDEPAYGTVVVVSTPHPPSHTEGRARALVKLAQETAKPLIHLWLAGGQAEHGLRILREAGASVATGMDPLVRALRGLSAARRMREERPPEAAGFGPALHEKFRAAPGAATLTEPEGKALLREAGIPVPPGRFVASEGEAVEAAGALGFPVVLKIVSPDVHHKTEVEGVRLNLRGPEEVRAAWRETRESVRKRSPGARMTGALIERFLPGVEMILGIARDPAFGPLVLVGTGGVLAEVLEDVRFALPPVTRARAAELIHALKGARLLEGFRGRPKADLEGLADLVETISRLAVHFGDRFEELDLNPEVFSGGRWHVLDALVRLRAPGPEG